MKQMVTMAQIYKELCPECKEKLIALIASKLQASSIQEQIKKQLEGGEK